MVPAQDNQTVVLAYCPGTRVLSWLTEIERQSDPVLLLGAPLEAGPPLCEPSSAH